MKVSSEKIRGRDHISTDNFKILGQSSTSESHKVKVTHLKTIEWCKRYTIRVWVEMYRRLNKGILLLGGQKTVSTSPFSRIMFPLY